MRLFELFFRGCKCQKYFRPSTYANVIGRLALRATFRQLEKREEEQEPAERRRNEGCAGAGASHETAAENILTFLAAI